MKTNNVAAAVAELERKKGPGGATDLAVHQFVHAAHVKSWPVSWGRQLEDWAERPWGVRSPTLDVLLAKAETEGIIQRDHGAAEPAWTAKTIFARGPEIDQGLGRVARSTDRFGKIKRDPKLDNPTSGLTEMLHKMMAQNIISSILSLAPTGSAASKQASMAIASMQMSNREKDSWQAGDAVTIAEVEPDVRAKPGDALRVRESNGDTAVLEDLGGLPVGEAWVANLRRAPLGLNVRCRILVGPRAGEVVTLKAQVDAGGTLAWETDTGFVVHSHEVARVVEPKDQLPF